MICQTRAEPETWQRKKRKEEVTHKSLTLEGGQVAMVTAVQQLQLLATLAQLSTVKEAGTVE